MDLNDAAMAIAWAEFYQCDLWRWVTQAKMHGETVATEHELEMMAVYRERVLGLAYRMKSEGPGVWSGEMGSAADRCIGAAQRVTWLKMYRLTQNGACLVLVEVQRVRELRELRRSSQALVTLIMAGVGGDVRATGAADATAESRVDSDRSESR
jgi:hypothetical protein